MINFKKINGWVFDIDDTLVLEHSYVLSGFAAVARWILSVHKVDGFYNAAVARFDAGSRGKRNRFVAAALHTYCSAYSNRF